jgi:hypothetical protein
MYKCAKDGSFIGPIRKHPADEDHTKPITKVICLESLGLFASASEDGTVKLWDGAENALLREIQFNELIRTICFCNPRGDLLVGLADQVALVRVQDYMPLQILNEILSKPDGWSDDLLEACKQFDSAVDFWELYRQALERQGADMAQWHISVQTVDRQAEMEMTRKIEELERKRALAAEVGYSNDIVIFRNL